MINHVTLVGNLGKKPEFKRANSGIGIAHFTVATTDRIKKGEQWENVTDWHNIVCFGKTAEFVDNYCDKGTAVYIEGKIKTRSWEDDGVKKYKTEIIADIVKSLTKKDSGITNEHGESVEQEELDTDLPF